MPSSFGATETRSQAESSPYSRGRASIGGRTVRAGAGAGPGPGPGPGNRFIVFSIAFAQPLPKFVQSASGPARRACARLHTFTLHTLTAPAARLPASLRHVLPSRPSREFRESVPTFCSAPAADDIRPDGQSWRDLTAASPRQGFQNGIAQHLQYPDRRLHKVAKPVAQVDDRIRKLVSDMAETMYEAPGVGLAATQVDVHERVIVLDISESHDELRVFITRKSSGRARNASSARKAVCRCPAVYDKVERPDHVRVRALNEKGETFEVDAEGLLAVCIQHEMDHLMGRVFVEYLSPLKQTRIKTKMRKQGRRLMARSLRVVFAGTPEFAAAALEAIVSAGFPVPLVLTQPDRPAGRGMKLQASAVKQAALRHAIPVAQPPSLRRDGKSPEAAAAALDLLRTTPHDVIGGRRLRTAAAPGSARHRAARLHQHPRFAAAALARCGAHPSRDRSRRRPDRHHDHADGRRARYRTDAQ